MPKLPRKPFLTVSVANVGTRVENTDARSPSSRRTGRENTPRFGTRSALFSCDEHEESIPTFVANDYNRKDENNLLMLGGRSDG